MHRYVYNFVIGAGAVLAIKLIYDPSNECCDFILADIPKSMLFTNLGTLSALVLMREFAKPEIVLLKQ